MQKELEQQLIQAVEDGVKNAYTKQNLPHDFRVGAAVLTDKDNIYSSGSYYSNTGSLTLHAEQAVLAHAAAHGEYGIVSLAIAWNESAEGDNDESVYPCHMCKQLLWESYLRSGINMEILIVEKGKIIERFFLKDIMSYTWPK